MRTKEIKLFEFNELSDKAKEVALDDNRSINVDSDWWYESVILDFTETHRLYFDDIKVYFSGFWSQGDGAMFEGRLDSLNELIKAFPYKFTDVDRRVLKLIDIGIISMYWSVKHRGHYYHSNCSYIDFEFNYNGYGNCETPNIQYELDKIESAIEEIYHDVCDNLYRGLECEYEFFTSDKVISEYLIDDNCEFLENGKRA